jgi:hypothetical protein
MRIGRNCLVLASVATLTLAACGGDDDDDSASAPDPTTSPPVTVASAAFCDARVAVEASFATEDNEAVETALADFESSAPADLEADVTTIATAFRTDPEGAFEDPEVRAAIGAVNEVVLADCDYEVVEVEGVEYAFEGVPETVPAGEVAFNLTNAGAEMHEIGVVRVNDGVTETAEELLQLPESEVDSKVTFLGGAFAPPGESDATISTLEPGRYVVACFVPTGTTPETEGDGPPHALEGMYAEFTVE